MKITITSGPLAKMAYLSKRLKNYKSSIQHFRLSVAIAKKYTWLMTFEQTFQKCSCQSTYNDFCFVCIGVLRPSTHFRSFRAQSVNLMVLNNVLAVHA